MWSDSDTDSAEEIPEEHERAEVAWRDEARREQQKYLELLGSRLWHVISPGLWTILRRKVGYGLYGDPDELPNPTNELTGYTAEKLKRIKEVCGNLTEYLDFENHGILFACLFVIAHMDGQRKTVPIFRAAAYIERPHLCVFVDMRARRFYDWLDFFRDETLPVGSYCAPCDGFYQADSDGEVLLSFERPNGDNRFEEIEMFDEEITNARARALSFDIDGCLEHLPESTRNDELFLLECFKLATFKLYSENVVVDATELLDAIMHKQRATLYTFQRSMSLDAKAIFRRLTEQLRGSDHLRGNAEVILTLRKIRDCREFFEMLANPNVDSSQVNFLLQER